MGCSHASSRSPQKRLYVVRGSSPRISLSSWIRKENVETEVPMKNLPSKRGHERPSGGPTLPDLPLRSPAGRGEAAGAARSDSRPLLDSGGLGAGVQRAGLRSEGREAAPALKPARTGPVFLGTLWTRQMGRSPLSFHPTRSAGLLPALFPCSPLGRACSRDHGDTRSSHCQVFGRLWACSAGTRVMEAVAGPRGAGPRVGSHGEVKGRPGPSLMAGLGSAPEGEEQTLETMLCVSLASTDQPPWRRTENGGADGGQRRGVHVAAPGMCADPLVNDGHAAVPVQLQLLPRGLEPQHLRQQLLQRLVLCNARESR